MQRHSVAIALSLVLATNSLDANAQDARDAELAMLKQQLVELATKVQELEDRSDAQSDVNIDTATQLDVLPTTAPRSRPRAA